MLGCWGWGLLRTHTQPHMHTHALMQAHIQTEYTLESEGVGEWGEGRQVERDLDGTCRCKLAGGSSAPSCGRMPGQRRRAAGNLNQ